MDGGQAGRVPERVSCQCDRPRLIDDECIRCAHVAALARARSREPWTRYLKPRILVPLVKRAMLEGWETAPTERKKVAAYLVKVAADGEGTDSADTRIRAAKALIEVDVKKATLEQNERLKAKDAGDEKEEALEAALRGILESATSDQSDSAGNGRNAPHGADLPGP
jgi:hypothetical protein